MSLSWKLRNRICSSAWVRSVMSRKLTITPLTTASSSRFLLMSPMLRKPPPAARSRSSRASTAPGRSRKPVKACSAGPRSSGWASSNSGVPSSRSTGYPSTRVTAGLRNLKTARRLMMAMMSWAFSIRALKYSSRFFSRLSRCLRLEMSSLVVTTATGSPWSFLTTSDSTCTGNSVPSLRTLTLSRP
ncbi:MAG: hypothetical protein MUF78_03940 [Candidatus Edwardsbacteria bacterium]|nr:hypothetical protein [Candidatus Edwardsbacteria bacterium]